MCVCPEVTADRYRLPSRAPAGALSLPRGWIHDAGSSIVALLARSGTESQEGNHRDRSRKHRAEANAANLQAPGALPLLRS